MPKAYFGWQNIGNIRWNFLTESTEGETLFKLVKKVITEYGLKLENTVGECFDGAPNMSGVRKSVAARMLTARGVCTLLRACSKLDTARYHE